MGAPENNVNAFVHGARARRDLVLIGLSKRWPDIAHQCRKYGRRLESLVRDQHGSVSRAADERINEAVRWEGTARACMRVADNPDVSDIEAADYLFKAGQASQIRRGCVERLGLDGAVGGNDSWASLDFERVPDTTFSDVANGCNADEEPS
jgi:hypothetical protein